MHPTRTNTPIIKRVRLKFARNQQPEQRKARRLARALARQENAREKTISSNESLRKMLQVVIKTALQNPAITTSITNPKSKSRTVIKKECVPGKPNQEAKKTRAKKH